MPKYITVANRPNRIATIHAANCAYLGPEPCAQTPSADRIEFEDGLEALSAARKAMRAARVFLRASVFKVRTWSVVQARRVETFLAIK
jgi:hypothetical protein